MSSKFFQLKSFLNYWLDAVDEHSLHSPFFFNFCTKVVKQKLKHPKLDFLKQTRRKLQLDHRTVYVVDFGSGSKRLKNPNRKIADIALTSSTPEKYSHLYTRIIQYFNCQEILELGTSLGINTLYLANGCPSGHVTTFEGSPMISSIARALFHETQTNNVRVIEGNIDQTLPSYLSSIKKIDFAFVDANHRFEPTVQYFEWLVEKVHDESIIILDDIYYSPEMKSAWNAIREHNKVSATVDLYRCGVIFFNPSLSKQNVVLQF